MRFDFESVSVRVRSSQADAVPLIIMSVDIRESLPQVDKPATILTLGEVDPAPLATVLGKMSDKTWDLEDAGKPNDYFCFHHTRHIILRWIEPESDPRDIIDGKAWPFISPVALPIMRQCSQRYGIKRPAFPKAMFARLEAGHKIDEHYDAGSTNYLTHKIHVPIQTNDRASFLVAGESFQLKAGFAYEVNNVERHGVVNGGDADRIHFIFEVFDDPDGD